MQNSNKINNYFTEEKSLTSTNLNNKSPLNIDINYIKQDILYFKNDVLKDIRKLEEKLFIKLNEQKIENSEQYGSYENKIENLTKKLSYVNNLISDKNMLSEKIGFLEAFKVKTENNFFALNTKISSIQKESKDLIFKYEKMINENLQYPGIIGTNAKFPSFRYFIDFVLSNIKVLNEFKEEIQNIDFNDYKKRINNEIQDLKYNINDNYRNTRNIVEDCIKETNSKISNFAFDFFKKFSENNDKIENMENKIKEYFNDYQTKITLIQDDFRDKYNQQFNQIQSLKNIQREYNYKNLQNEVYNKNDNLKKRKSKNEKIKFDLINLEKNEKKNKENDNNTNPILFKKLLYNKREIKSNPSDTIILNSENYEKIKEKNIINSIIEDKTKEQKIIDSNKQDVGDHLNNKEVNNITENNANNKYTKLNISKQLLSSRVSLYNKITNSTKNNSNNKINSDEIKITKNIEDNKLKKIKHINHSFEFIKDKRKNPNKELNNSEVKKKIKNLNFNFLQKFQKKIFPNNYSITNIPHINFKKIVIPVPLDVTNNFDGLYNTFISDDYFKTIKESINFDKNSLLSGNQNNNRNIIKSLSGNNLEKINNIKGIDTIKMKNNKMNICQKESKYDSLKVYHIKNKDYISNSFNNIKKENKNKSLSYEKYKSDEGIYITSGVRKINKQKDKDKTKKIFTKKYEFLYNIKV